MNRRGPKTLGDDSIMIAFKAPRSVATAQQKGAAANFESPASYARRALVEKLRADGLLPPLASGEPS